MGGAAITSLLGEPEFYRGELQSEFRRYDLDGCALDLYLYRDAASGERRVVWFEVRTTRALDAEAACGWLVERLARPDPPGRSAALARS